MCRISAGTCRLGHSQVVRTRKSLLPGHLEQSSSLTQAFPHTRFQLPGKRKNFKNTRHILRHPTNSAHIFSTWCACVRNELEVATERSSSSPLCRGRGAEMEVQRARRSIPLLLDPLPQLPLPSRRRIHCAACTATLPGRGRQEHVLYSDHHAGRGRSQRSVQRHHHLDARRRRHQHVRYGKLKP